MNELERQLLDLGSALQVPPAPDLLAAIRGRLVTAPAAPAAPAASAARGRSRRRRLVLAAVSLVLVLTGTAVAVPPLRHAIEQVLGLRGASVQRVPTLPPLPADAGRALNLGRRIPVASARHAVSFRALLPATPADAAYISGDIQGGRVTLTKGRVLIMEFRGRSVPYLFKLAGPGTRVRSIRVGADPGLYVDGAPHEVLFENANHVVRSDTIRLAGNVLLWQHGPLIIRIEGARSLANALAIARSLS